MSEASADYCADLGGVIVCGTSMVEHSRRSEGIKWCFRCRKRVEFERIVMAPDGLSYYGPTVDVECSNCHAIDGDLFPGWYRAYPEDCE